MKNITILITMLLFCSISVFAQPKIEVQGGTVFDLGEVYSGMKAEHVVKIKNVGHDMLRISDIKPQCGCTATMMSEAEKTLNPNAEGKLSISINTTNFNPGKYTKQVYITSNDTSSGKLSLFFNLNVITALKLDPMFISFDNCKLDTTYTKSITLTNPSKEAIRIVAVNLPTAKMKDMMKADLMKNQLGPGESTQLQVVFHATKSGSFDDNIDLMTDSKAQPKFQVKVYTWVTTK